MENTTPFAALAAAEQAQNAAVLSVADKQAATLQIVKETIVAHNSRKARLAETRLKIVNEDRFKAIIDSRETKSTDPVTETILRLSGETKPSVGNIAVFAVGLPAGVSTAAFMAHVKEFTDDTHAIAADMWGMGSVTSANHDTDGIFKKTVEEVYNLALAQSGQVNNVLSSNQPFSDVHSLAINQITNGD